MRDKQERNERSAASVSSAQHETVYRLAIAPATATVCVCVCVWQPVAVCITDAGNSRAVPLKLH